MITSIIDDIQYLAIMIIMSTKGSQLQLLELSKVKTRHKLLSLEWAIFSRWKTQEEGVNWVFQKLKQVCAQLKYAK